MAAGVEKRVDVVAATFAERAVKPQPVSGASEDTRLVTAARQGDRVAFGLLYDRYAGMVHGVLLARVPIDDVEDLVHEVFLQALRRLASLRDDARFGGWLAAIARNAANDYHRHAVASVSLDDEDARPHQSKFTIARIDAEATAVLDAIRALPEAYKEPLILRLVEGMTGPEIAARTGLTPGSVRVNLHRGMRRLRERLSRSSSPSPPQQELPSP